MLIHLACAAGEDCSILSTVRNGWDSIVVPYEHAILRFFTMEEAARLRLVCREFADAVSIAPFCTLRRVPLQPDAFEGWAEAGFSNASVRTLSLRGERHVERSHVVALAAVLKTRPASFAGLQRLDFSCASGDGALGAAGATALAAALGSVPGLSALILSGQAIRDAGAAALAVALPALAALTTLVLKSNGVRNAGAVALSEALPQLRALALFDIHDNCIGSSGAAALSFALAPLAALASLDVGANKNWGDAGARSLSFALLQFAASKIAALSLASTGLRSGGAVALAEALPALAALRSLRLSDNSLGLEGLSALAAALAYLPNLVALDLSSTFIHDAAAAALASALPSMRALSHLNLSDNSICASGAGAFATALAASSVPLVIETLLLDSNSLGDAGTCAFAAALPFLPSLRVLGLSRNSIGATGAASLSSNFKFVPALRRLALEYNELGVEGASALAALGLRSLVAVEELDLSECSIGDGGAAALAKVLPALTSLEQLWLDDNAISSFGFSSLALALPYMSSLKTLHLCRNAACDGGAAALSAALPFARALCELSLSENSIGPVGAAYIAAALPPSRNRLTHLDLGENAIGPSGAAALASALPALTSLSHLDVGGNSVGAVGAAAIAAALPAMAALSRFNLSATFIGEEGATALAAVLPSMAALAQLDLSINSLGPAAACAVRGAAREGCLVNLVAWRHKSSSVGGVGGALGDAPLFAVSSPDGAWSPKGVAAAPPVPLPTDRDGTAAAAAFPETASSSLFIGPAATAVGAPSLAREGEEGDEAEEGVARPPHSSSAPGSSSAEISLVCGAGEDCSILSTLRNGWDSIVVPYEHALLRYFTTMEAAALRLLCREFEDAISIAPFPLLGEDWAEVLFRSRSGHSSAVIQCRLHGWMASFPNARVSEIVAANVDDDGLAALAAALSSGSLPCLKSLNFRGSPVWDAGLVALAACLPRTALVALDLRETNLGDVGILALAEALPSIASSLKTLRLTGASIWRRTAAGAVALADGLPYLRNLTELSVGTLRCGVRGAAALAEKLPTLPQLLVLGVPRMKMPATAIAEALPSLTALVSLDASVNRFSDEDAAILAAAFASMRPPTLKRLNLGGNSIGSTGARSLALALPSMMALEELWLHANFSIGDAGAAALAAALPSTKALRSLYLGGTAGRIHFAALHPLAAVLSLPPVSPVAAYMYSWPAVPTARERELREVHRVLVYF